MRSKTQMKLARAGLKTKAEAPLYLIQQDPLKSPPGFERRIGNLSGFYSRRINIYHRLVYQLDFKGKVVHVLRMWTQYE